VAFWAIDASWSGETPEKARRFLASKKWAVPWAFDNGGADRALGVDSLPTVALLDKHGRVRWMHYGYDASEHVDDLISKRVEELLAGERH
jgi:predicted transcriptional regulator